MEKANEKNALMQKEKSKKVVMICLVLISISALIISIILLALCFGIGENALGWASLGVGVFEIIISIIGMIIKVSQSDSSPHEQNSQQNINITQQQSAPGEQNIIFKFGIKGTVLFFLIMLIVSFCVIIIFSLWYGIVGNKKLPVDPDGYIYSINEESISIKGNESSNLVSLTIPAQIDGKTVTSIENSAFCGNSNLENVIIPASVTSIGFNAFGECNKLERITIPFIGATADESSYLHFGYIFGASTYSENAQNIPPNLNSVIMINGTRIDDTAFVGYSWLSHITIPDSVQNIGSKAFNDCIKLKSANVPTSAIPFISKNELETVVVSSGEKIEELAFAKCSKLKDITITDSISAIGNNAFTGCSGIKSATIPILAIPYIPQNSLETVILTSGEIIEKQSFKDVTTLKSISIPASVTRIDNTPNDDKVEEGHPFHYYGEHAFWGCSGLKNITVDEGNLVYASKDNCLIEIETKTLILGCSKSIIPNDGSVTKIGWGAFHACDSLKKVEIPESIISIGDWAFAECKNLTQFVMFDNVEYLGYGTFCECENLENISLPDSLTQLNDYLFFYCTSLRNVNISEKAWMIGDYAFCRCTAIQDIVIPDSVLYIYDMAFFGCTELRKITISENICGIEKGAFGECISLTDIKFPRSLNSIGKQIFMRCANLSKIVFENSTGWYIVDSDHATSGTNILSENLSDHYTAAQYLTSTYADYYWRRKKQYIPK